MATPGIVLILPLYKKFAYGRRCALSFFKYTSEELHPLCLVVDDHSPPEFWEKQDWNAWMQGLPKDRVITKRFSKNDGLTRSWNWGLRTARDMDAGYTVCGNSDTLFSPHWYEGIIHNLENGWDLLGPVTNAPGPTNGGRQRVHNFFRGYKVSDDAVDIVEVAEYLHKQIAVKKVVRSNINGFTMIARTDTWWSGAFNSNCVFNPKHKLVFQEDELQRRWSKLKRKVGFVPSSFIFHYRAVSRGNRYKHGAWYRLKSTDLNKPV